MGRPISFFRTSPYGNRQRSPLQVLERIPQGLNRQGHIPFAAVIDWDIPLSLFSHRFLHQIHGVSPQLWKLFHNFRVRFRSFFRRFIRHLERRQEAQDRKGCGEEITDLFRRATPYCGGEPIRQAKSAITTRNGETSASHDWSGGVVSLQRL